MGLGQYEPKFRENEIDERVLPSLTADDLKDLGVKLVGAGWSARAPYVALPTLRLAASPGSTPASTSLNHLVAERVATCIFDHGLARVPRPDDVGALIRARAYRPVYPA